MSDLIDRQALLKQIDIDSDGEPGYYGDTWKFIDTIKSMPSATDKNVGTKLGTDLAQLGTDCISRQVLDLWNRYKPTIAVDAIEYDMELRRLLGTNLAEVGTDCISRQSAMDAIDEYMVGKICATDGTMMARLINELVIKQLPSVQLDTYWKEQCQSYEQTINKLRESLSTQPEIKQQAINSSDCIDRRAAIDALDSEITITGRTNAAVVMGYCKLVKDRLERLPSAQPEPKRGKWHYSDGKPARIGLSFGVVCDQCGTESEYCTNFCGECGADMREVTNGN